MNQRKAGTLLSYLHILVSNTISIIYTPYMLQMMGQSEYGLTGTASSFISYLSVLSFGIGGAYIRFNTRYRAANDREGEKKLNGMFLTVFSFLSLLVLIGGLFCVVLVGQLVENTFTVSELFKLRVILVLLTINMMITFIFNVVMMALQSYEKYLVLRIVALLTSVITPIINIIALKLGGRAITITAISLIISIVCYIFYFCYARKVICLEFSFKGFDKNVLKEIFIFSGFLFLNSITDQITFSTDNIVLSAVKGTSAVAVYTVGANFKGYFQQFSTSISSVFAPSVNMMVAKNQSMDEINNLFIRVGRIQFYVVSLILIGYISIGQDFICLWAGEEYRDAFYIGLLLMLSVFVPSFQNVGLEIQKAKNMHHARSIIYFFISIINICLTIPFSIMWGGIGAALATTICMVLGYSVFMNWHYYKRVGLNIYYFWKSILGIVPSFIPAIILGIIINRCLKINSIIELFCAALAITIVFSVSVYCFGMNNHERNLINIPIKKLINMIWR